MSAKDAEHHFIDRKVNSMPTADGQALMMKYPERSNERLIQMACERKLHVQTVALTWVTFLKEKGLPQKIQDTA